MRFGSSAAHVCTEDCDIRRVTLSASARASVGAKEGSLGVLMLRDVESANQRAHRALQADLSIHAAASGTTVGSAHHEFLSPNLHRQSLWGPRGAALGSWCSWRDASSTSTS